MNIPEPIPFKTEGPQPLMREIAPGPDYPSEALGPLRAAVEAVQAKTQAPIAIAAQSALSVASLAVQAFANVETLGGFAPTSLFCLTIAGSGERKSTCDKLLMAGVRDHEREQAVAYGEAFGQWKMQHKIWTAKHDATIKQASGAKAKTALETEVDLKALGPEPLAPLAPNLIASDPTFEGLCKLYMNGQPALGLFSDEAGGFIGGHAMNKDNRLKTAAGLSTLWDGEPLNRTRAGDGAHTLLGRRLASHLMMQPVAAYPFLADPVSNGQGILARFLICEPQSTIGTRFRNAALCSNVADVAAFNRRISIILETPKPLAEHSKQVLEPRELALSPAARELLGQYHDSVERLQAKGGDLEMVRPFASKSAEQAARIAGVLTLWDNLEACEVSETVMSDAIMLAQYYLSEAKRMADLAVVSEDTAKAERLRQWLLEGWPGVAENDNRTPDCITPRDVAQFGPGSVRETKDAKRFLGILEKHGWVVELEKGTVLDGVPRLLAYRIVRD